MAEIMKSPEYAVHFLPCYDDARPTEVIIKITCSNAYDAIAMADYLNIMPTGVTLHLTKTAITERR